VLLEIYVPVLVMAFKYPTIYFVLWHHHPSWRTWSESNNHSCNISFSSLSTPFKRIFCSPFSFFSPPRLHNCNQSPKQKSIQAHSHDALRRPEAPMDWLATNREALRTQSISHYLLFLLTCGVLDLEGRVYFWRKSQVRKLPRSK